MHIVSPSGISDLLMWLIWLVVLHIVVSGSCWSLSGECSHVDGGLDRITMLLLICLFTK